VPFRFRKTRIAGVVFIEPQVSEDDRGFFMETYKRSEFAEQGISEAFVQSNHSRSTKGVLRGLHYQRQPKAQGKLVRATVGEIFDVVVDLRRSSPTYGDWLSASLSSENKQMVYVPQGFAHGFCVVSDVAEVQYMTTEEYAPTQEAGIIWNDPQLGITWPMNNPMVSVRDQGWPRLREAGDHFNYAPITQSDDGITSGIELRP
jgi:dTDP-4-dehydrorhamnose 3,5-epimerase